MTATVADLKAHLNLDHDLDDTLLAGQLAAAVAFCTDYASDQAAPAHPAFREAVLRMAAALYESREDGDPSAGAVELLRPLRTWSF